MHSNYRSCENVDCRCKCIKTRMLLYRYKSLSSTNGWIPKVRLYITIVLSCPLIGCWATESQSEDSSKQLQYIAGLWETKVLYFLNFVTCSKRIQPIVMVVQLQGSRASCGHSCAVFCHAITFGGLALLKVGKSRKQFSFLTHLYKINKKNLLFTMWTVYSLISWRLYAGKWTKISRFICL